MEDAKTYVYEGVCWHVRNGEEITDMATFTLWCQQKSDTIDFFENMPCESLMIIEDWNREEYVPDDGDDSGEVELPEYTAEFYVKNYQIQTCMGYLHGLGFDLV